MQWIDVAGPPGSGKSTLCDPLWGPHDVAFDDSPPPAAWHDFLNEVTRLLLLIDQHPTLRAAVRMNRRSVRKMAAVSKLPERDAEPRAYIQTGFLQRGLGFGWRLVDLGLPVDELRPFMRLMPVSLGVVICQCREDVVMQRNRLREQHPETAHENRSYMVPLMQPAIELAIQCLQDRNVPLLCMNTERPVDEARAELVEFAAKQAGNAPAIGPSSEAPSVLSLPIWW